MKRDKGSPQWVSAWNEKTLYRTKAADKVGQELRPGAGEMVDSGVQPFGFARSVLHSPCFSFVFREAVGSFFFRMAVNKAT